MKTARSLVALALAVVGSPLWIGCPPRRPPATPDREPPVITLQIGSHSFSTAEGADAPEDACVEVRAFPARLSVAAGDRGGGGIARVVIGALPGPISDVSVAPTTADAPLTMDRLTHVLTVTTHPPAGTVQPNILATFQIAEASGLVVRATDTSGLSADLFQVDVRPVGDPVICRGEVRQ